MSAYKLPQQTVKALHIQTGMETALTSQTLLLEFGFGADRNNFSIECLAGHQIIECLGLNNVFLLMKIA